MMANTNELIHCLETLIDLWKSEHEPSLKRGWTHTTIVAAENAIAVARRVEKLPSNVRLAETIRDDSTQETTWPEREPDEPDCAALLTALQALVESAPVALMALTIKRSSRIRHGIPLDYNEAIYAQSDPYEYAKLCLDIYGPAPGRPKFQI